MKRLFTGALAALLLFASPSFAQIGGSSNPGVVTQGAVTPGNIAKFVNRFRIQDGGAIPSTFVSSFNSRTGAVVPASGDYTISQITNGLNNTLTNGHIFVGSAGNVATDVLLGGDCSIVAAGTITCTRTNNVLFAASATTDTTNAGNIGSGTLSTLRLPSPFTSGTASGNTAQFATVTGAKTNGNVAKWDVNGNLVDGGAAGTGTVTSVVIAPGNGISVAGTCTISTTGTCTITVVPPVVCVIYTTAATTCNNGTSQANAGTYTPQATTKRMVVIETGGGGGGGGGGTGANAGAAGSGTSFNGVSTGAGGGGQQASGTPGTGGSATGGYDGVQGSSGGGGLIAGSGDLGAGGGGGGTPWAMGSGGGSFSVAVPACVPNSGAGGGGGSSFVNTSNAGGGGGGGGTIYQNITGVSGTYAYSVGTGGAGGTVGTGTQAGGAGCGGRIVVWEYGN